MTKDLDTLRQSKRRVFIFDTIATKNDTKRRSKEEKGRQCIKDATYECVCFSGGETYQRFVYALQQCKRRSAGKAMHTCVPWLIAHTRSNPAGAKNQVKANSVVGLHAARQAGVPRHLQTSTLPACLPTYLHTDPSPAPLCAASALRVMHGSTTQQHRSAGNHSPPKEMLVP